MATIGEEIKQQKFASEKLKANINIIFTSYWISNRMGVMLKPYKLTHEQFNVLRILRGKHPESMCQKDILERMIARQSNLTLIVQKLKDKKLVSVTRSAEDSRQYVIQITRAGLKLLEELDEAAKPHLRNLSNLTEAEAAQLNLLLDKLRG